MKIKNVETKIGHEAERIYTSLAKTHEVHQLIGRYYFFKRFKTVLYNKNNKDKIKQKGDAEVRLCYTVSVHI